MNRIHGLTAAACGAAAPATCGGSDDDGVPATTYSAARDTVTVTGGTVAASADSTAELRVFRALPFAAQFRQVYPVSTDADVRAMPAAIPAMSDEAAAARALG